jgi:hypothetical protein
MVKVNVPVVAGVPASWLLLPVGVGGHQREHSSVPVVPALAGAAAAVPAPGTSGTAAAHAMSAGLIGSSLW